MFDVFGMVVNSSVYYRLTGGCKVIVNNPELNVYRFLCLPSDDAEGGSKFKDCSRPRDESPNSKRARKKAAKDAQADKRKEKVKKHVKKRKCAKK